MYKIKLSKLTTVSLELLHHNKPYTMKGGAAGLESTQPNNTFKENVFGFWHENEYGGELSNWFPSIFHCNFTLNDQHKIEMVK